MYKRQELISDTKEFDGTNYIDTGVALLDVDRDFTLAIDFQFDSENSSNATLFQCYQYNGNNGVRLWYNQSPTFNWGNKSTQPLVVNGRDMLVIRHIAGDENLYIYDANLSGNEGVVGSSPIFSFLFLPKNALKRPIYACFRAFLLQKVLKSTTNIRSDLA